MSLTPTLSTPGDVMAKLAREHTRAFNSLDVVNASDHLYNFCVTSLAVCDFLLEHLNITTNKDKKRKIESWELPPRVIAAHDIGNSSKHCVIRYNTEKIQAKSVNVDSGFRELISLNPDGSVNQEKLESVVFTIITNDTEYDLWDFMSSVRDFWEELLTANSVSFEKLPHREWLPFST